MASICAGNDCLLCDIHRAGELSAAELEQLMVIVANPRTFKIPDWFLNRQKDFKDGRNSQLTSSALDTKLREDLERLKKIRLADGHLSLGCSNNDCMLFHQGVLWGNPSMHPLRGILWRG
jgi:hypothetical protein